MGFRSDPAELTRTEPFIRVPIGDSPYHHSAVLLISKTIGGVQTGTGCSHHCVRRCEYEFCKALYEEGHLCPSLLHEETTSVI